MFSKLSKLLFEEEDDIEEMEEEEETVVEKPQPVKAAPAEKPAAAMQRIDVTQPIETPVHSDSVSERSLFSTPSVAHAEPAPLRSEAAEEKPKAFGLTVDDRTPAQPPKRPAARQRTTVTNAQGKSYEFRPVISPIFGVDEKDMNAISTTAKIAEAGKPDMHVSKVISPIYGTSRQAEPISIQNTVEKSNELETLIARHEEQKAETDIPDFSLDDILNARDEEYARNTAESASPAFSLDDDDYDETVVIDSRHLTDHEYNDR